MKQVETIYEFESNGTERAYLVEFLKSMGCMVKRLINGDYQFQVGGTIVAETIGVNRIRTSSEELEKILSELDL